MRQARPAVIEARFAAALLDPNLAIPAGIRASCGDDPARRFAVYRNNVVGGLVNALAARFPVLQGLVGEAFFRAMAREYVLGEPPRSPLLFLYGEGFPAFVERFEPVSSVPYLADVARLELACGRAYHAADAKPLGSDALASVPGEAWPRARLRLHPSVELCSSRFPIVAIWRAHQGAEPARLAAWEPQDALVARPGLTVQVHLLPPGGHGFLAALMRGSTLEKACGQAALQSAGFDLVRCLEAMVVARILVGVFHGPKPRGTRGPLARRPVASSANEGRLSAS